MGLINRIMLFFRIKTSAMLAAAEDPRETTQYAYERQAQLLQKVKAALVGVTTSKKQLQVPLQRLEERVPELQAQAAKALEMGREDLAKRTLQRRYAITVELDHLRQQVTNLEGEEQKLGVAEQQFAARLEAFRTQREVMLARYTASEAQNRIGEALTGVSGEYAEIGLALERAQYKMERTAARAQALDELAGIGSGDEWSVHTSDPLEREMASLTANASIEDELLALKAGLAPQAGEVVIDADAEVVVEQGS